MFKTQLSSNLVPEKILIVFVWFITIFSFSAVALFLPVLPIILIALILVLYSIYIVYMASLNVSYDASFLFIVNRKTERIIPLANITEVKRSSNLASPRTRWKINYVDHNGVEDEVLFYPEDNVAMTIFTRTVRIKNPLARCD